jgi:ferritin-like metal-binding protein YciE
MASKFITKWLNDAYSMEKSMEKVLENHAKDAKDHPEIQARIEQHLAETREHAQMIENCLNDFGESPSALKSMAGNITGFFQGVSSGMAEDEMVKNAISDYAAEHFEIASYRALQTYAEANGHAEVAEMCQRIIADEVSMAASLEESLHNVVGAFAEAKRAEKLDQTEPAFGERLDDEEI